MGKKDLARLWIRWKNGSTDNIYFVKKLYLDVDGVLLTLKNTRIADFSIPFIHFITKRFDCYWLTTHCKGNIGSVIAYLSEYFDAAIIEQLAVIKPTNWQTLKTEAIDFSTNFYWIDDYPLQAEFEVLKKHDVTNKLVIVDLSKFGELNRIIDFLQP